MDSRSYSRQPRHVTDAVDSDSCSDLRRNRRAGPPAWQAYDLGVASEFARLTLPDIRAPPAVARRRNERMKVVLAIRPMDIPSEVGASASDTAEPETGDVRQRGRSAEGPFGNTCFVERIEVRSTL